MTSQDLPAILEMQTQEIVCLVHCSYLMKWTVHEKNKMFIVDSA